MNTWLAHVLVVLVILASAGAPALAADADLEVKAVMDRIKQRTPKSLKLKDAGTIGETWKGLLETVKATKEKEVNKLVTEENTDREKLFRLLATKSSTTVQKVRQGFAVFRFRKAANSHFYKGLNGAWLTREQWLKKGPPGPFAK